jgi:hypothetical protein
VTGCAVIGGAASSPISGAKLGEFALSTVLTGSMASVTL